MVFVESTFGRQVVVDDQQVAAGLRRLEEALAMMHSDDRRLDLIDRSAVEEVARQLELLAPWARRIRSATAMGRHD